MALTKEGKAARVKLANVLVRAGYNRWKVLDAIRFPTCTGFTWNCLGMGGTYNAKPDDDWRLQYERLDKGSRITFAGADRKRNVTWYEGARYTFNESPDAHRSGMRIGTKVLFVGETRLHMDVFDGWGTGYQARRWMITFTFSDGSIVKAESGKDYRGVGRERDMSIPNYYTTGPHYHDYYPNGWAIVPPALEWTMPEFLEPGMGLTGSP